MPLTRVRQGLGPGCHGSRLPGGSPTRASRSEGAGELPLTAQSGLNQEHAKRGGRPAHGPSTPQHTKLPREGSSCFREKKILFLLGLKVGLPEYRRVGGRGEQSDCHLRLGVLMCLSLGLAFYTPQRLTWNPFARPSHEVM